MHPAKNLTAFAADDYLSKDVVAAKGSGLSVRACVDDAAADEFLFFMAIKDMIFRHCLWFWLFFRVSKSGGFWGKASWGLTF